MATVAQPAQIFPKNPWKWFVNFLLQELAPYPGRVWIVARMTIAATLVMLWIMTFRIPGAALGAYYTLLFSRDTPQATVRSVITTLAAVGSSLVFVLVGAAVLAGDPFLHFIWVSGTLFVTFFLISALSEYRAATAFGFLAVNSIAAWDFPANTEARVEGTLWTALAVAVAACVTVAVEMVSQRLHPFNQFAEDLDDRLRSVENLLRSLGQHEQVDERTQSKLAQYAMTGTATLRQLLLRSNQSSHHIAQMSALAALSGRLVDLSANLCALSFSISNEDRPRYIRAAGNLELIRSTLASGHLHGLAALDTPEDLAPFVSYIGDIENTISRIPQAFAGGESLSAFLPSAVDLRKDRRLFKGDAFTNTAHLRFALKGTLAAAGCYVIYNGIAWPGLSTAVATCMITALSTVGGSRQKQLLRVAGALIGGVGLAMTSQVFLLPFMDGISAFTVLFVAVTLAASWVATSSPRLSYAGVQTAFAFYITHLRGFAPQTSLAVARDDVMGILFGLLAMWVSFDQIWAKKAVHEMMDSFVANLRRIALFGNQLVERDLRSAIDRSRAERAAINSNFDQIRNESDAVIFEFGPGWQQKVSQRNQVRAWQPQLRTYFLLQIGVAQYRVQSSDRLLDPDTERNVQMSEKLLALLADLNDPHKKDQAETISGRVQASLNECQQQFTSSPAQSPGKRGSPYALSRAMLDVAVSLGKQMVRAEVNRFTDSVGETSSLQPQRL